MIGQSAPGRDFQPKGHRTFVTQRNAHVRPEPAGGDHRVGCPSEADQMAEQSRRFVWQRRSGESRAVALAGVGGKGELGHEQQAAARIAEGQVHAALRIAEDPVGEQALEQPPCGAFVIERLHPDQDQKTRPDRADALASDIDTGGGHSLQKGDHA